MAGVVANLFGSAAKGTATLGHSIIKSIANPATGFGLLFPIFIGATANQVYMRNPNASVGELILDGFYGIAWKDPNSTLASERALAAGQDQFVDPATVKTGFNGFLEAMKGTGQGWEALYNAVVDGRWTQGSEAYLASMTPEEYTQSLIPEFQRRMRNQGAQGTQHASLTDYDYSTSYEPPPETVTTDSLTQDSADDVFRSVIEANPVIEAKNNIVAQEPVINVAAGATEETATSGIMKTFLEAAATKAAAAVDIGAAPGAGAGALFAARKIRHLTTLGRDKSLANDALNGLVPMAV